MDWTRGRVIGHGSTATVSIATAHRTGQVFAVKSAELSKSEFLKREQRILSTLRCPQLVAYKGCNISSENGNLLYNLFLEYAPAGTLTNSIHEHGGRLGEAVIRSHTVAILLGLQYLHSHGIVHCDIKGQNILVTNDGAKLADLGCARRVDDVPYSGWSSMTPIAGTPVYMAPEVARGEQQGFSADVWALGCTIIEMATGRAPWPDVSDPASALYRIGFSCDLPEIPNFLSAQARDFLSKCLKRDPKQRWSASELLQHEFLNQPIILMKEINTLNSDTPTSVLDHGFWDSMEELEPTWISTLENSSNCPVERIKILNESSSELPNWSWDANWVTVRSNEVKEPELFNKTVELTGCCTSDNEAICWVNEENNLTFFHNEPTRTCGIDKCISSSSRHKTTSLRMVLCKCSHDVCINLNIENIKSCLSLINFTWVYNAQLVQLSLV